MLGSKGSLVSQEIPYISFHCGSNLENIKGLITSNSYSSGSTYQLWLCYVLTGLGFKSGYWVGGGLLTLSQRPAFIIVLPVIGHVFFLGEAEFQNVQVGRLC